MLSSFHAKVTILALTIAVGLVVESGNRVANAQSRSILTEPLKNSPTQNPLQNDSYGLSALPGFNDHQLLPPPVLRNAPPANEPSPTRMDPAYQQAYPIEHIHPADQFYPNNLAFPYPADQTYEASPMGSGVYEGEFVFDQGYAAELGYAADWGCGAELGCGVEVMPTVACDAPPACGCEAGVSNRRWSRFRNLMGVNPGHNDCDGPCSCSNDRPGLIMWANDYFVSRGIAVDRFLVNGSRRINNRSRRLFNRQGGWLNGSDRSNCLLAGNGYFSVDYGLSMTGDRSHFVGNTTNLIDGTPTYDLKVGSLGRFAIGIGNGKRRAELELGFHRNSIGDTKFGSGSRTGDTIRADGYRRSTTYMFNGYRDFINPSVLTPYLKAGAGLSHNKARGSVTSDITSAQTIAALGLAGPQRYESQLPASSTTQFAWAVGGGLAINLTRRVKFDIDYQFLKAGKAITGYDVHGDAINLDDGAFHELAFGLRFYR